MPNYIVQGNTSLYRVSQGGVATTLTLPTGVTLYGTGTPCRFAQFGEWVIVVNGATKDLFIGLDNTVRVLKILPPSVAPTLAASATTAGFGAGARIVAYTQQVRDPLTRKLIMESGFSPVGSYTVPGGGGGILATNIEVSEHQHADARGVYYSTAGGTYLFTAHWIDSNIVTDFDVLVTTLAGVLPVVPEPAPDFKLIAAWKDRLWGVPRLEIDNVRWSEERTFYSFPSTNEIVVPKIETDTSGVTAIIPRRDDIGFGRKDALYRIIGDDNESYQRQKVDDIGVEVQESVVVVRNIAYFLGRANGRVGVFEWSDAGVRNVSERQVDAWFNTDTYFNRSRWENARGRYNPDTDSYELLLASQGQTTQDYWVSFRIRDRVWHGPHKTAAFTNFATGTDGNLSGTLGSTTAARLSVFGGTDGFLYKRDSSVVNDHNSAIDFDIDTPFIHDGAPDIEKVWMQPTIHSRIEAAGTLTVTPKVGGLGASAGTAISHTLTLGRERLRRLGLGRYVQLNMRLNTVDRKVRIFGIELPWLHRGRR